MRPITILLVLLLPMLLAGCNELTKASVAKTSEQTSAPLNAEKLDNTQSKQVEVEVADSQTKAAINATISPKGKGSMLQGTVRYMNLEGGFWGIVADNGQHILPKGLATEYRKDGLRLSFSAQEITDMMTIQQWGTLSSLSDIKIIGQVDSQSSDPRL